MNSTRRRFLKTGLLAGGVVAASGCNPEVSESQDEAIRRQPLRILILGGTGFIGPHMVREALRRGHQVELFNRGRTNNALFPDLKLYKGDRDNDLDSLAGGSWDVVVDNSGYVPRHVEDSARLLAPVVSRYLYTSTVSVYGDVSGPVVDEDTAVGTLVDESVEEVTGETYGPLKALCEKRVLAEIGAERTTILRPTYVCGPGDRTDRYTYWPARTMLGGEMLWPGTPEDEIQIIDVRDLATFTVDCLEQELKGIFNTVTPPKSFKMGDLLDDCQKVTASDMIPTWVSTAFLNEQTVRLPIWEDPQGEMAILNRVDGSRAIAAGLKNRPTRETARDTVAWWKTLSTERTSALKAGLTLEREMELLSIWEQRNA